MKFGVNLPQFDAFGDVALLADLASQAEEAGWDAFFIWDHILFDDLWHPMVDPWVALAAVAMRTKQIRIGTMVTPVPRRRPWKLAREVTSIDRLSNGRFILGVGIGDPTRWEYESFGEEGNARVRAEKLDEGLEILQGLWSGESYGFKGKHFQLDEMRFLPTPVQEQIPIWVGGYWPNKPPLRRAARFDGICPGGLNGPLSPDDWRKLLTYVNQYRTSTKPFDAVHGGSTPGDDRQRAAAIIQPYADVGVNWWIESISPYDFGIGWADPWTDRVVEQMIERIQQGPSR